MMLGASLSHGAPLDIDVSNPPSAGLLDTEKTRLNIVNRKIDEVVRIHDTLMEGHRLFSEELLPNVGITTAKYLVWTNKLFVLKDILADVDDLTTTQEDNYRAGILEVLSELYDITVEANALRTRINNITQEIYLVRVLSANYLTADDSPHFPVSEDVFNKLAQFRSDLLASLGKLSDTVDSDLETKMNQAINTTKDIVDELFVIRSLDYPELSAKLEDLRSYTVLNTFMEPKYVEIFDYKENIASAIQVNRPYAAVDELEKMQARATTLVAQIESSDFLREQKDMAQARINNSVSEAQSLISYDLFSVMIAQRYSGLPYVFNVCKDTDNDQRYNFDCGTLFGIYGLKQETVMNIEEEDKLRYLEFQMDKIIQGGLGYE